ALCSSFASVEAIAISVSARSRLTKTRSFARSDAAIGSCRSWSAKRSGWRRIGCGRGIVISFATGSVAKEALPGIKLRTEGTQTRQREARKLPYRHRCRSIFRHPDRQLRQRAVRLADD